MLKQAAIIVLPPNVCDLFIAETNCLKDVIFPTNWTLQSLNKYFFTLAYF